MLPGETIGRDSPKYIENLSDFIFPSDLLLCDTDVCDPAQGLRRSNTGRREYRN